MPLGARKMGILTGLDKIASAFGAAPKATNRTPKRPSWVGREAEYANYNGDIPNPADYNHMADMYKKSPPYYAAVNLVARAVAMSKVAVYESSDEDSLVVRKHPFIELLKRPAPNMQWLSLDQFTVLESIAASLMISGGAYLYLCGRDRNNIPQMLLPLRPDRISPTLDRDNGVEKYEYNVDGKKWEIPIEDIVYIKQFNPTNDYIGLSTQEPANYPISTDLAAQRYNWNVFRRGIRASGVIESDQPNISVEQRELMERYWTDTYTGDPRKAHQLLFLWDGFKFKDLGLNMRDTEYVEGRKINMRDILMVTGVHPTLLMQEGGTKATATTAEYLFAKYTLYPLCTRIAARISAEIMPLYNPNHEFRFVNIVPRDDVQATQRHAVYLDRAVLTINQVRLELGLSAVDWGDVSWPELRSKLQNEQRGVMGSRDNQPFLEQNSARDIGHELDNMSNTPQRDRKPTRKPTDGKKPIDHAMPSLT